MIINTVPGGAETLGGPMNAPVAYEVTRTAEMTERCSFGVTAHWPRSKYWITVGNGVGVGASVGVGVGVLLGDDEDEVHAYIPQDRSEITRMIDIARIVFPHAHSPRGLGESSSGTCNGFIGAFNAAPVFTLETSVEAGFIGCFGAEDDLKTVKASHARVSALTCIPYLIPVCLALEQLKIFCPGSGLKLAQLPHMLLLIYHHTCPE